MAEYSTALHLFIFVMFNTVRLRRVVGDTTLPRGIGEHVPNKLTACSWHTRARELGMDWFSGEALRTCDHCCCLVGCTCPQSSAYRMATERVIVVVASPVSLQLYLVFADPLGSDRPRSRSRCHSRKEH